MPCFNQTDAGGIWGRCNRQMGTETHLYYSQTKRLFEHLSEGSNFPNSFLLVKQPCLGFGRDLVMLNV